MERGVDVNRGWRSKGNSVCKDYETRVTLMSSGTARNGSLMNDTDSDPRGD